MKKFSIIFGSLIFLVFAVFSVIYIAYDTHEHTFVDMKNNSYHWQECSFCHFVPVRYGHVNDGTDNCSLCGGAIGPTEGVQYSVVNDHAVVTKYDGKSVNVYIAPTYNGKPVTVIGENAFNNTNIWSIKLPDSVTSIGNSAFRYCENIKRVTLPHSVESIGNTAFAYCTNLTEITIPDSVTRIGNSAFNSCYNLSEVALPDSITYIGSYAFNNCHNLANVTLPNSLRVLVIIRLLIALILLASSFPSPLQLFAVKHSTAVAI